MELPKEILTNQGATQSKKLLGKLDVRYIKSRAIAPDSFVRFSDIDVEDLSQYFAPASAFLFSYPNGRSCLLNKS